MKVKQLVLLLRIFFGLKPNMHLVLVNDSSKNKKEKGENKNIVATISDNNVKMLFLNNECLRHLMDKI